MIAAIPLVTSALSMLTSTDTTAQATKSAAATQGADFSQVMSQVSGNTVDSLKAAESASIDGITGKANVQSVVQAVMTAQENLQAALAIRDKAVGAFTEISHMAI